MNGCDAWVVYERRELLVLNDDVCIVYAWESFLVHFEVYGIH